MKPSVSLLLLLLACASVQARDSIETVPLDDRVVVSVPVATNRVTSLSFPSPIEAIDAAGVSMDPKQPGPFLLAHTTGSAFLSVRALTEGATANLNVRHDGKTYVFELHQDLVPVLSLKMVDSPLPTIPPKPHVTPGRLLSLLDRARAYHLLKEQHPEAVAGVEARQYTKEAPLFEDGGLSLRLNEVFRFQKEDSLVFRVTALNPSDQPVAFPPDAFRVRIGNRLFHASISDATGLVPPSSEVSVLFAVTGAEDGERADLSLKNAFQIQLAPQL